MPIGRLAAGCPSTHALSARDPITSKSIFAQLVIIVRNVFDSRLFGYQAGSNAKSRTQCEGTIVVLP